MKTVRRIMKLGFPGIALAIMLLSVTAFPNQLTNVSEGFDVPPGGTLHVSLNQGDVVIRTGVSPVAVEVFGIDQQELGYLEVRESGGDVYVTFEPDGRSRSNLKVEVGIPENFNVNLSTAGGDIQIQGNLSGFAKVKTAGGDIQVGNVEGETEIKTAGGDIEAGDIAGGAAITTAGGDIKIGAVNGEADVKTAGGDITIDNVGDRLTASTSGGDIELGNVGGDAVIKTAGGDIEVGQVAGSATLKTAGGDIVLESAQGRVAAGTAGGDLELRNISGSLKAKTAGGDILAEMDPGTESGPSSLETAGGDIRLYLPAGVRARIEAVIEVRGNWERGIRKYGIYSDFPEVQIQKDASAGEIYAQADLNGGGEVITLSTVNGNIYIKHLAQ